MRQASVHSVSCPGLLPRSVSALECPLGRDFPRLRQMASSNTQFEAIGEITDFILRANQLQSWLRAIILCRSCRCRILVLKKTKVARHVRIVLCNLICSSPVRDISHKWNSQSRHGFAHSDQPSMNSVRVPMDPEQPLTPHPTASSVPFCSSPRASRR